MPILRAALYGQRAVATTRRTQALGRRTCLGVLALSVLTGCQADEVPIAPPFASIAPGSLVQQPASPAVPAGNGLVVWAGAPGDDLVSQTVTVQALDGTVRNRSRFTSPIERLDRLSATHPFVLVRLAAAGARDDSAVDAPEPSRYFLLDAATGQARPVALPAADWEVIGVSDDGSVGLLRDGGRVAVLDLERSNVAVVALAESLSEPVRVSIAPSGTEVAITDAGEVAVRIDTRTAAVHPLVEGGPGRSGGYDRSGRLSAVTTGRAASPSPVLVRGRSPLRAEEVGSAWFAALGPLGHDLLLFDERVRLANLETGTIADLGPVPAPVPDARFSPSGDGAVYIERGERGSGRHVTLATGEVRTIDVLKGTLEFKAPPTARIRWYGGPLGDGPLVAVDLETGEHQVFPRDEVGFVGFPDGAVSPTGNHLAVTGLSRSDVGSVTVFSAEGTRTVVHRSRGLSTASFAPNARAIIVTTLSGPTDRAPSARIVDLAGTLLVDLGEVADATWVPL